MSNKGTGEKKLELDRRKIEHRITELKKELEDVGRTREVQRKKRQQSRIPQVALVGYTKAGKSTILNRMVEQFGELPDKTVMEKDMLFATLETSVRSVDTGHNKPFFLTDTVGFINKLPHGLVKAFRSTLEEAIYADLLIVVSDLSSPNYAQQRDTVFEVLNDLGATDRPILEVLNKADRVKADTVVEPADAILISARDGTGLETLKAEIARRIAAMRHRAELVIPYSKGNLLSMIHSSGQVLSEEYLAEGTKVDCLLDMTLYQKIVNQLK